jgi:hypothetical protein
MAYTRDMITRLRLVQFSVLAVVVIAGLTLGQHWYLNYRQYHGRPTSHLFTGQLFGFQPDGNISARGTVVSDLYPEKSDYAHPQLVTVIVSPTTKFVKTVLYMPTHDELIKSGGKWDPANLHKEEQAGSFDDLKKMLGTGLNIKTNESIYLSDTRITAQEVDYTTQVYPDFKPTPKPNK